MRNPAARLPASNKHSFQWVISSLSPGLLSPGTQLALLDDFVVWRAWLVQLERCSSAQTQAPPPATAAGWGKGRGCRGTEWQKSWFSVTCCHVLLLEPAQPEFKMLPSSSPCHTAWMTTEGETVGQPAQSLEQNASRFLNLSLSHWINCQGLRCHLFLFIWKITHSLTAEMASDKPSLWKLRSRTLLFHCLLSQKYSGEDFFFPSLLSEAA